MKTIPLTRGQVTIVDDDTYEELSKHKWLSDGRYAKRDTGGRRNRVSVYMHRYLLNAPPNVQVDHVNRNKLDNRRSNLRFSSFSLNQANTLNWLKSAERWHARIKVNGKQLNLGYHRLEEDAAIMYNVAAQLFFGEFAHLNDV